MKSFLELLGECEKLSASQSEAIKRGDLNLLMAILQQKSVLFEQLMGMADSAQANAEKNRLVLGRLFELEREANRLCNEAKLEMATQLRNLELASRRVGNVALYREAPQADAQGYSLCVDV